MGKVRNILQTKGNAVYTAQPSVTVYNVIELMCEKNVGAILITEEDRVVGIFTERDYARKLVLKGKSSKEALVKEMMTSSLITVNPEYSIEDCMKLMTTKHIRHLPVMEDGELVGLISIGDVVRYIIDEQKSIIEHLEYYITGHQDYIIS